MFDFPSSPTNGQQFTPISGGPTYVWQSPVWKVASGGIKAGVWIGDTPPAAPISGMLWYESDSGNTFIWYPDADGAQWVQFNVAPPVPEPPATYGSSGRITLAGAVAYKDIPVGAGANFVDIAISGMSTTGTGNMYLQLFHSGGVQQTGYSGSFGIIPNAAANIVKALTDAAFAASYFPFTEGSAAASLIIGNVTMRRISTSDTWVVDGRITLGTGALVFVMGNVAVANPLTAVRLGGAGPAGNLDGGFAEVRWTL